MTTQQQLAELAYYYASSRQVGHTTAMMRGAKVSDCLILAHNQCGARNIKLLAPMGSVISLASMGERLRGIRKPLLIDNAAMSEILQGALAEIERLEQKVATARRKAQEIIEST